MVSQSEIKEIAKIIVKNYKLTRLVLFGSYAYGNPTEESDLDLLVVVKNSNQPRYKRAGEIRSVKNL